MRYAVVEVVNNEKVLKPNLFVSNVIVGNFNETEKEVFEDALGAMLIEASELGLCVGDLYNGLSWTRNVEGEQITLPLVAPNNDIDAFISIMEGNEGWD